MIKQKTKLAKNDKRVPKMINNDNLLYQHKIKTHERKKKKKREIL